MSHSANYFTSFVGLLVIANPLLAIPLFTSLSQGATRSQRNRTARRTAWTVAITLTSAALLGDRLLRLFGIPMAAFQVGGGILMLLMGIAMMHARLSAARHTPEETLEAQERDEIGVVPLGIPLLAGPGAITTVILYAHQRQGITPLFVLLCEIWLLAALVWLALRIAAPLNRMLGTTGINVANRIMGLLLSAIAVDFITLGMRSLLPGLA